MGKPLSDDRHEVSEQLDTASDWQSVAGNYAAAIALKGDGSLWKLNFSDWRNPPKLSRLGRQNDWITVAAHYDAVFAVAADGSIWRWDTHAFRPGWFEISASRIPTRLGNALE